VESTSIFLKYMNNEAWLEKGASNGDAPYLAFSSHIIRRRLFVNRPAIRMGSLPAPVPFL
jgi:hypothetical protein